MLALGLSILAARPSGLVGSSGLEPPTSRLSGARSNHLSYEPIQFSVYLVYSQPVCLFRPFRRVAIVHRTFSFSLSCVDFWLLTLSGGGDDGNRTHDPLLAGQVLSQLSYTPIRVIYLSFLKRSLKIEQQSKRQASLRTFSPSLFLVFAYYEYELSTALQLPLMFSIERR